MAWLWVAGMRGAEEELEAQRGELGEFRRKVEGERKNYKRLLKAQEAKMHEQEKARAVRIPQPSSAFLRLPVVWLHRMPMRSTGAGGAGAALAQHGARQGGGDPLDE